MYKTKKYFLILILLTVLLFMFACSNSGSIMKEYTIDSAINIIEDAGYLVQGRTSNFYGIIGASDGANINVGKNEIAVELYINSGNIDKTMFINPQEGKRAFIVSNLCVYIHSNDDEFYNTLKKIFSYN
ncbi:hypothetical protein [Natronospora cellulosivora (SeqCode)]